ncbi:MAG: hypothetical protein VWZ97_01400 [Flavobacteriaceae bacterium]
MKKVKNSCWGDSPMALKPGNINAKKSKNFIPLVNRKTHPKIVGSCFETKTSKKKKTSAISVFKR